jgi:hypothetical protein
MKKLNFILRFLLNFILKNKAKTIAIIALSISIPFLNSLPDVKNKKEIVFNYQKESTNFYIVRDNNNNKNNIEYNVYAYGISEKPNIKDNYIIEYKYNDLNIPIWLLASISLIMILVGIFSNDDDLSFNLSEVYMISISSDIICELENDTYFYFLNDRFLGKSNEALHQKGVNLAKKYCITKPSQLNNFPKWKTKTQNRVSKLEEIGV